VFQYSIWLIAQRDWSARIVVAPISEHFRLIGKVAIELKEKDIAEIVEKTSEHLSESQTINTCVNPG
jgi:hypothetical protein